MPEVVQGVGRLRLPPLAGAAIPPSPGFLSRLRPCDDRDGPRLPGPASPRSGPVDQGQGPRRSWLPLPLLRLWGAGIPACSPEPVGFVFAKATARVSGGSGAPRVCPADDPARLIPT